MIKYKIINNNQYSTLAELRWIFQCEENSSLELSQKDGGWVL